MANVKFPGIEEDLTAPNTPWIYYGVRMRFFFDLLAMLEPLMVRDHMRVQGQHT